MQCTVHESSIQPPITYRLVAEVLCGEDLLKARNKPFIQYMGCSRPDDSQSHCPINSSIRELKGYVVRGEMAYTSVALQLTHGAY